MRRILDSISDAALVVAGSFRIRYANAAAQDMLSVGTIARDSVGGITLGNDVAGTEALREVLAHGLICNGAPIPSSVIPLRPNGIHRRSAPLIARLVPLCCTEEEGSGSDLRDAEAQDPEVLLMLSDPQTRIHFAPGQLEEIFGLTAAEARVAELLSDGLSIRDQALLADVSVETVRSQLKSVFSKTGTHRQADLVVLMTRLWFLSGDIR